MFILSFPSPSPSRFPVKRPLFLASEALKSFIRRKEYDSSLGLRDLSPDREKIRPKGFGAVAATFPAIHAVLGDLRIRGRFRSIPLLFLFHLTVSVLSMVAGIGKPKAVSTEHSRCVIGDSHLLMLLIYCFYFDVFVSVHEFGHAVSAARRSI
ncbi:hypothetical protein JCGZ_04533 [Jatropha curcas]|uniref:Uncharacterized protein n=1 Tax=Jatropha curcas TaxID=180498 RepID=A0A067LPX2_JATCU|nr:hypothetical protein JCGZ_04533 [Jatropha curcas]